MNILQRFIEDESGLTAVEYAVAGSLVAGVAAGAFTLLGDAAEDSITCLNGAVNGVANPC
ncbi:Flp family type IVb pilin [Thalassotalea psychrophila]|uniref:Flp family type IVb pilin n=1 Tax=Thalassotalea psychrophila TaxID=3065647 RepID=A0ABY9TXT1_9GAMM|nr:Flp family type IVb pilin [Colwelliaceae bacterium SQ149]